MVVCKFFLQGTCRFGTKCNNEHLDIKQLVKTDVESAINGKQWPLSCFGPFKDKPCVPNFIEDQSFEEVRWLCYDAKQKNCVDQFIQQFTKEAMEANQKMKTLLQLPPQVIDIICRLYDTPVEGNGSGGLSKTNPCNPFGLGTNITKDNGSFFAKSSATNATNNTFVSGFNSTVSANNSTSVFGGGASVSSGNIFSGGSSTYNTQQQQSSIFPQQMSKPPSMFGANNTQTSVFGQTQTNSSISGGLFGQAAQSTSGLFGPISQQASNTGSSGLFAQAAQPTQCASNGSIFAQQTPAVVSGGNLFTQCMQQQQQLPNSGNLFNQGIQQQTPQLSTGFGLFSQATKQPIAPGYAQQTPFGQQQNASGVFNQMIQQPTPTNNSNNFFGQPSSGANSSGIFVNSSTLMSTQNLFPQTTQQQETSATIFPQAIQTTANSQPSSIQAQPILQLMGGNTQPLLKSPVVNSSVYSKLEDLTNEQIEAFQADTFTPGKIPNVPPPRELIN